MTPMSRLVFPSSYLTESFYSVGVVNEGEAAGYGG